VAGPSYQNHRWLFAKFPDFVMHSPDGEPKGLSPLEMVYQASVSMNPRAINGPIKGFKSTLDFVEGNEAVVQAKTIEVNHPFSYKGYTFYQSGYNPDDPSYTSLQVVKDPGRARRLLRIFAADRPAVHCLLSQSLAQLAEENPMSTFRCRPELQDGAGGVARATRGQTVQVGLPGVPAEDLR
jgi:hypothetical protein